MSKVGVTAPSVTRVPALEKYLCQQPSRCSRSSRDGKSAGHGGAMGVAAAGPPARGRGHPGEPPAVGRRSPRGHRSRARRPILAVPGRKSSWHRGGSPPRATDRRPPLRQSHRESSAINIFSRRCIPSSRNSISAASSRPRRNSRRACPGILALAAEKAADIAPIFAQQRAGFVFRVALQKRRRGCSRRLTNMSAPASGERDRMR